MGIHQHIEEKPKRGELGGLFNDYKKDRLKFVEVIPGYGCAPKKIKTKKAKRSKQDESVVIVFHDVASSQDVHLTLKQAKQKLEHYRASDKPINQIQLGLSAAHRFKYRHR